jgi:glutamate racemase
MAWEISETSHANVGVVATEGRIDRMPVKESLVTACKRLSIDCWDAAKFVAWVWQQAARR